MKYSYLLQLDSSSLNEIEYFFIMNNVTAINLLPK